MSASRLSWLEYPARVRAATAILVLTALFTLARLVQIQITWGGLGLPEPTRLAERFQTLRAELPHVPSVGYVTDSGPLRKDDLHMDDPDAQDALREFFFTRYILAPTTVTYGASQDYVVGNLSASTAADGIGRTLGLEIVRDYGNGVVLFRRRTP